MLKPQYYVIDVPKLESYLGSLEGGNPQRTHGHLDLFLENIKTNLTDILKESSQILLEVDHNNLTLNLVSTSGETPISNRKTLRESTGTPEAVYEFFLNTQEQEIALNQEGILIQEINPPTTKIDPQWN